MSFPQVGYKDYGFFPGYSPPLDLLNLGDSECHAIRQLCEERDPRVGKDPHPHILPTQSDSLTTSS